MKSPYEFTAIVADLEKMAGPNVNMDRRILSALGVWPAFDPTVIEQPRTDVTASVDLALSLMERMLPGWGYHLWKGGAIDYPDHPREIAMWGPARPSKHIHAQGATLPLGILAGMFSGLAAR